MAHEKTCFVIAPIGETDSETRKRSDQVLKHVIRPAVHSCGYKAVRADEIDKPGMITSQVIQRVVNDPLVVADLTERNPNVFYELAIRHALRKPLVQLIRKGDTIPFDVAGTRTIHVDHRDLDSVESARNEIVDQVRSLEKDASDLETPISVSLDLQLLRQSERPEERSLADLVSAVVDLRSSLANVESRIGAKDQQALDQVLSMLRSLPERLEDHFDLARGPRRGRLHPMMVKEFMGIGFRSSPSLAILFIASFFRDSAPFVYEPGVEVSRLAREGDSPKLRDSVVEFRKAIEYATHHPLFQEVFSRNKDFYMLMEETEPMLDRLLDSIMTATQSWQRRKRAAVPTDRLADDN